MHTIPSNHRLYLMGDYHSNQNLIEENLLKMQKPSSLIILGDYDAYEAQDLVNLANLADSHQVTMYLMRGNHDHPKYWQDRELADALETPHFKLLHDVDSLQWGDLKLISVSGAVSVDRTCIRYDQGHCWPKTEGIPSDSINQLKELGKCDILLTHTGIIDGMTTKNDFIDSYASTDDHLIDDIKAERKLVQRIQIASGCTRHYFGHFHQSWKGEQFGVDVRCLDICELLELTGM